jgi:hypothetical protein
MRSPPAPLLRLDTWRVRRSKPWNRAALWLLLLAVLTVQMLSLLHGVAHAGRFDRTTAEAEVSAVASEARNSLVPSLTPRPASWIDLMFAGHGGADCDAFDQASHADLVFASPPSMVAAASAIERMPAHIAWHIAAQARGFLARGPPVVA